MKSLYSQEEKAFTLVEILISLAITSVVMLLIGFFMTRQSRQADFLHYRLNMQTVYDKVEQGVISKTILGYSALFNNDDLFNCLNKDSADPCKATDPASQVGLFLYDFPKNIRDTLNLQGGGASIADLTQYLVTGTGENPARYDFKTGALCTENSLKPINCQYEVKAFFWATCQVRDHYLGDKDLDALVPSFSLEEEALPQECDQAQAIHIRFQVSHNFPEGGALPFQIASIPRDSIFGDYSQTGAHLTGGAVAVPVRTIPPVRLRSFLCSEKNESLLSLRDGSPNCECLFPFSRQAVDGSCQISSGGRCDFGERYRGTDKNTGEPICQTIYCETVEVSRGCAKGGWIEGIKNNFWFDPNHSSFTGLNSCAVMTDMCDIREPNGNCAVEVLCNQSINCCYETEPNITRTSEASTFTSYIDDKISEHKDFLEGGQGNAGTRGYEGTICSSDSDCDVETDYDPKSDITYDLLCCSSGDGSENRCRRGVYAATRDYQKGDLFCPTRCHDKMDPNVIDPNKVNWAKDYCETLRSVDRVADLDTENVADGFILPDDPEEYSCVSHADGYGGLRISHQECKGWGYKWGSSSTGSVDQYVGCCDNKCISNFNEFEDEASEGEFDKVCSFDDNCDEVNNPAQTNLDKDDYGDACDVCPEDPLISTEEDYTSSCACVECPYEETSLIPIVEPAQDLNCDNYLCYDTDFMLYHLNASGTALVPFYAVEFTPNPVAIDLDTSLYRYFGLIDEDELTNCESLRTACSLYYKINSNNDSRDFGNFYFSRINKSGNYRLAAEDLLPDQRFREEMVIDSGDFLHFKARDMCDTPVPLPGDLLAPSNQSNYICNAVVVNITGPETGRLLFSDSSSSKQSFVLSILPENGASVKNLALGSAPSGVVGSGKCAGPFALKSVIPSADRTNASGIFDKKDNWLHHGANLLSNSSSVYDELQVVIGYGSPTNPQGEAYLSAAHNGLGRDSVKFWACKQ